MSCERAWKHAPALIAVAVLAAGFAASSEAASGDWPQFRGGERSGVAAAAEIGWGEEGPRELWRKPLGEGYSSLSVAGDRVYTLWADDQGERLGAFARASGEPLWSVRIADRLDTAMGNGPRSTPTVAGGAVYALGAKGDLVAVAADDGKELWRHNLPERFGSRPPQWGFATSPLVDGDRLVLEVGGSEGAFAALDRATGEVLWQAYDKGGGYSSPIVMTIGGVKQYVFVPTSAPAIVSLLPDGSVHWTHEWHAGTIAMPVAVGDDAVFVSASNDVGAVVVRIGEGPEGPKVEELWRSREMKNHFSSSVYHDGHLYGFDGGTLKCVDAETGERRWVQRGLGKGSLLVVGDRLLVLGDRGQLALAEATPEAYRELARTSVLGGKTWTPPTLAGDQLFVRNHEEMVAFDLSSAAPAAGPAATATEPAAERGAGER